MGVSEVPCIWCDQTFSNRFALANHCDNVHKGGAGQNAPATNRATELEEQIHIMVNGWDNGLELTSVDEISDQITQIITKEKLELLDRVEDGIYNTDKLILEVLETERDKLKKGLLE